MSDYIIAATKDGHDISETDPNSFIFHSLYNTFKIIKTGTLGVNLAAATNGQVFTLAHNLLFTPLVTGFAIQTGVTGVFPPNSINISFWGPKVGLISTGVTFVSIGADATNMIFKFNNSGAITIVTIRYFCLEGIS